MSKKPPPVKPSMGICAMLLRLKPSNVDEDAIRLLVGNRAVKNLPDVATEFGVEPTTLRSSWRLQGMPGSPGKWPLAEILLWRLRHEAEIATRQETRAERSGSDLDKRQAEAECRKAELVAERLEREMEVALGNLIDRRDAATAVKAMLAVTSQHMLSIPRDLAPSIPTELAPQLTAEMERQIRRTLTALAEKAGRLVLTEASEINGRHYH